MPRRKPFDIDAMNARCLKTIEDFEREQEQERQRQAAVLARRKVDTLLKRAARLREEVWTLARFVEDEIEAPDAVANLICAGDHANMLVEALLIEASPEAVNALPEYQRSES